MGKVILRELYFYAYHGFYEEEQRCGGYYTVDVEVDVPFGEAIKSDDIVGTLDYEKIYAVVRQEMDQPSKLIEHVGARILTALANLHPDIEDIHLRIIKKNPPLGGICDQSEIVMTLK